MNRSTSDKDIDSQRQSTMRVLKQVAGILEDDDCQVCFNDEDEYESDISDIDILEPVRFLADYIDCLMETASALRNSIFGYNHPRSGTEMPQTAQYNVSSQEALNYCKKISDRFPHLSHYLVERLGEANSQRYRSIQSCLRNVSQSDSLSKIKEPEFTDTTKSTYKSESVFDSAPARTGSSDDGSQTTFATASTNISLAKMERRRAPKLPANALLGRPFDCLACGRTLSDIASRSLWK